jgi:hypothetical protein
MKWEEKFKFNHTRELDRAETYEFELNLIWVLIKTIEN